MGLDRGGPTHKQNMSIFFPLSHPYTAATAAQIFVDNIFIAWNVPHSIVSDRGPGLH